ncbi:MAG TPA: BrnA antitoxin family protein [Stellaceae bacterium]|nr:BrnA antitoxin family protein [Stellaceae bacterium]
MAESKGRITRVTLEEARRMKDETDYARLDAMTDEDIARAVAEDPDAAPVDADWSEASLVVPPGKQDAILWVDDDVLAWFRATGKGFHTRMNAVLRAYMEAHKQQPR